MTVIAVTAATGQLGRLVIDGLEAAHPAADIVALVRSPEKAADLGVAARAFDYSKPETLLPALAGIDTLLLISSSEVGQREAQHRNVIGAARQAGIGRIVYTSVLRADTSPLALAAEHLATEKAIAASGIPATILRNGWYTENQTAAIPATLAHGALIGAAGDGRFSWASRADYAAAAVAALTGSGHENRVYELAGDKGWTLADFAAELSRQAGREVPYVNLSQADYAAALVQAGLPAEFAGLLADSDIGASQGALFDDGRALSQLIGRPTTPVAESIAAALG